MTEEAITDARTMSFIGVEKYQIAKAAEAFIFVYGLYIFLAPHKAREIYNPKELKLKDPQGEHILDLMRQRAHLSMVLTAAAWFLHVQYDLSRDQAIGIATMPWVLTSLHGILNDTLKKTGVSTNRSEHHILIMSGAATFATLTDHAPYLKIILKIFYTWVAAVAITMYAAPNAVGTLYGCPEREDYLMFSRRCYGHQLLMGASCMLAMLWGVKNLQVVAFGWAVAFVGFFPLIGEMIKHNFEMMPIYFWLALQAFVVTCLLV